MRKTRKEIIDETYEYYIADPSRRGLDGNGSSCTFLTSDGRMCAVGRCLLPPVLHKVASSMVYDVAGVRRLFPDQEFFKEEYNGHPDYFWDDLQTFHDMPNLWRGAGSEARRAEYIAKLHAKWDEVGEVA